MKDSVRKIIERYGDSVTLHAACADAGVATRAFIQPLMTRTVTEKGTVKTPLGITDNNRFFYIGPPEPVPSLIAGAWVARGDEEFEFLSAELIRAGDELIHCEGILKRRADI